MTIKTYLVGGAVRDTLLGLDPKDRDYVVVGGTPADLLDAGYEQVGQGFPVFLHPSTREEYALARAERKTGVGYGGFEFDTDGVTLVQDLERRDFTMNSMAMDGDNLIDPFGGERDLKNRIIRHTSAAFSEDPLRVIRLARFFNRYDTFTVAEETMTLASDLVDTGELDALPRERFWAELEKAFADGKRMNRFFELLFEVGALQSVKFFNELCGGMFKGQVSELIRVSNAMLIFGERELRMPMFIAAVSKRSAKQDEFPSARSFNLSKNLQAINDLPKKFTALELYKVLMQMRAGSPENHQVNDVVHLMAALEVNGIRGRVAARQVLRASDRMRAVRADKFMAMEPAQIGVAVAQARMQAVQAEMEMRSWTRG